MTLRKIFHVFIGFSLAILCSALADLLAVSYRIYRSGGVVSGPLSLGKAGLIVGVVVPVAASPWLWKRKRFIAVVALVFAVFAASVLLAGK